MSNEFDTISAYHFTEGVLYKTLGVLLLKSESE